MKKFLFLLILILATCLSILISVVSLRHEHPELSRVPAPAGPVSWIVTGIHLIKPFLFKAG